MTSAPTDEQLGATITQNTFDAIVIGSGITGGWAAKELCERGLKTLVIERGRNVRHIEDYTTALLSPWQFPHRLQRTTSDALEDPIQSTAYDESSKAFFVRDAEHPYIQEKPFYWIRGYQVGGRSLTWGRQCYRLSDLDFEANVVDGHGVDWPVRYADLAPWYDYVERFIGVSGRPEGLPQLPDGDFLPPMGMTCVEQHFSRVVREKYSDRIVTIGRTANLTVAHNGRGPCQYRNLCWRGCPWGAYFSSNAATLPAAAATKNLTLLPDSIAVEVLYDERKNRASGVRVRNQHTRIDTEYFARVLFVNASTIATAALLLNSTSGRFPNGFGNSSGQVGHNLMDHFMGPGAVGEYGGLADRYYSGRRPTPVYVPRFRNVSKAARSSRYVRGFGYQGWGRRENWSDAANMTGGFGGNYKQKLLAPGPWNMVLGTWGEILPRFENAVSLDRNQKDTWGLPLVRISFEFGPNERAMASDAEESAAEMLEATGFKNVRTLNGGLVPAGSAVHEMGTARMGRDPRTSVLNEFNQMHDVKNVFITDGSCMTSSACQNPSLTYMALTARACDYAVGELKRGNL